MQPDLARFIRPGDGVLVGQACAEPQTLVEALVGSRGKYPGARVFFGASYSGLLKPEHADHLRFSSYCGIGGNRALVDAGAMQVLRVPYSSLGPMIHAREIRADVVLVQVSPPNEHGEYSLGLAADYLVPALETARVVLGEVHDQVPWTNPEKRLRKEDFALLLESSRAPATPPAAKVGDLERAIAANALPFVPDGATIEFGIGALPDALCTVLSIRKDLKIHSGTVGDGVVDLVQGAIVKQVDCAVLIGSRKLFEWARSNPRLRLRSSEYTHGPEILGRIERFVAVNSAVEVDYSGAVNSELARGSYVGAVGGAPDFMRAAARSPGGAAIVLVPSQRIVAALTGPVSTPGSDVGLVVTERGVADLRGRSPREREERLRAIGAG